MPKGHIWTKDEEQFLRDSYRKLAYPEIAEALGLHVDQVKQKAGRLKITISRAYPAEHIKLVRELYSDRPTADIAKLLGKSVEYVYGLANSQGIHKTEEYKAQVLQDLAKNLQECGKGHRFKKGDTPPNKGLRRPGWGPGRMKETQFKKGNRTGRANQTYKPIGTERISKDGYLERKVNDDMPLQARWKQVHRIVWEEHNGPIPDSHVIVFKDGNKLNCDIANLKMLTRQELMSRNTVHNLPAPVREAVHALGVFRRKLNTHAKKQNRRSA